MRVLAVSIRWSAFDYFAGVLAGFRTSIWSIECGIIDAITAGPPPLSNWICRNLIWLVILVRCVRLCEGWTWLQTRPRSHASRSNERRDLCWKYLKQAHRSNQIKTLFFFLLLVRYTVLGNFRKYLTTIRARWRKRSRTGILCQTLTFVSIDTSHDPTQREREYFYPSMQLALIEIAFRVHRAQNTTFPASVPTTFQICVFFYCSLSLLLNTHWRTIFCTISVQV